MRSISRRRRIKLAALLLLLLAGLLPARAAEKTLDRAVALVNQRLITMSEVAQEARTPNLFQGTPRAEQQGLLAALNRLIDQALILQLAGERGITADESLLIEQVELAVSDLERGRGGRAALRQALEREGMTLDELKRAIHGREQQRMIVGRTIAARVRLNREDVAAFQRQMEREGKPSEFFILRQVLLKLPADAGATQREELLQRAEAIHQQLKDGVAFTAMVRAYSEDPYSREYDGFLGALGEHELDPAIYQAVKDLQAGEFSAPVLTRSGCHLFYLIRKHAAREILFDARFEAEMQKLIRDLREQATIRILDDRFANALSKPSTVSSEQ